MTIDEIIEKLRFLTGVSPRDRDYYVGDAKSALRQVLTSEERKVHYAEYEDSEIKAIITFLMEVVDIPETLLGLYAAEECIRYMLRKSMEELSQTIYSDEEQQAAHRLSQAFVAIFDQWLKDLNATSLQKTLAGSPNINQSYLLSYHLAAREESLNQGTTPPFMYEAYGYSYHKKLMYMLQPPRDNARPSPSMHGSTGPKPNLCRASAASRA